MPRISSLPLVLLDPQTRATAVTVLSRDDANGLQHRLAGIPAEHRRVVDPFKAGFELCVERVHGSRINAGCRCEGAVCMRRRRARPHVAIVAVGGG
jgi:hypothetical protein